MSIAQVSSLSSAPMLQVTSGNYCTTDLDMHGNCNDVCMKQVIDALRSALIVKDRRAGLRVYERCFVGKEAVDVFVNAGLAQTRAEAVRIGKKLASWYDLFEHVERKHEFEDDHYFYRFKYNKHKSFRQRKVMNMKRCTSWCSIAAASSPSLSSTTDSSRSMDSFTETAEDIVRTLRKVMVKDRRFHLILHKQCFVGKEAVDLLVAEGHAETRKEAVLVLIIMNVQFNLYEYVGAGQHELRDGYFLYRFKNIPRSETCSSRAATTGNFHEVDVATYSTVNRKSIEHLWIHIFQRVEVKDRWWRLKEYKQCFIGSDLVDLLCSKCLAKSRADAVRLGRVVNSQLNLFEHVTREHAFNDDFLFYRFKI